MAVLSKDSSAPFVARMNAQEFADFKKAKADPDALTDLKQMADELRKNIVRVQRNAKD